jgi:hypothetical protein
MNDPINLIFAPCEDFGYNADRQARNVELGCGRAAQVVEVQVFIGNSSLFLCGIE